MSRRVVVLRGLSLLTEGVQRLCSKMEGLEVVGVDLAQPGAWESIAALHPETVIVDSVDLKRARGELLELLRESPQVRVLCLDMASATVDVYRRQRLVIDTLRELMQLLQQE